LSAARLCCHLVGRRLRGWDERRQVAARAVHKARRIRNLLERNGVQCPTGAGTGSYEFEAASDVYAELQCGTRIFLDADYGRNPTAVPSRTSSPVSMCARR
jgi:D-serine deaminase-like pyridoxal phosphate-dependent protein